MKKWGIIGCLFIVAAVCVSFFCKFDSAAVVAVALAAFGFAAAITGAVKKAKEQKMKLSEIICIVVFSAAGGVLCCIGGLNQSIFAELAGAVLALLTIIFGVLLDKSNT